MVVPAFTRNGVSKPGGRLHVLRRWNSFTPMLPSSDAGPGGGYFLEWRPEDGPSRGIVIDPGFDFLANFQLRALDLSAINAILLTHSHIDHGRDFETILTAKYERGDTIKRRGWPNTNVSDPPLDLFLSLDSFHKFGAVIDDQGAATVAKGKIKVLTHNTSIDIRDDYGMVINIIPADHGSDSKPWLKHSVSLIFDLYASRDAKEPSFRVALTSDSRASEEHAARFRDCDVIVAHLGTVSLHQLLAMSSVGVPPSVEELLREWEARGEAAYKRNERSLLRFIVGLEGKNERSEFYQLNEALGGLAELVDTSKTSAHMQFAGVLGVLREAFKGRTQLAVISEFGLELGSLRHKVADAICSALLTPDDLEGGRRIITGDIGLSIALGTSGEPCQRRKGETCANCARNPEDLGGVSLVCSRCDSNVPTRCISDFCIRWRDRGMVYNCPGCAEAEYAPPDPLVALSPLGGI
jgi:beta-lactamase family protein